MNLKDLKSIKLEQGKALMANSVSLPKEPQNGSLCFVKSKRFLKELFEGIERNQAKDLGLIVPEDLWSAEKKNLSAHKSFTWVATTKNFDQAMIDVSKVFYDQKFEGIQHLVDGRQLGTCEIDPSAEISQNVFLGDNVKIAEGVKLYPGCVVGSNVSIGAGTILFPNVTIYSFTKIGSQCRIHSGVVIGGDGFGYNFIEGMHKKVWHFGGVEIGNDVEIGANTTIDMGTFTPTKIGEGSKLDDQVMIAHNVQLGRGVVICGHTGCAGSSVIGDFTFISGNCSISNDTKVGSGCQVAGATIVTKDIPDGQTVAGYPATDIKEWRRSIIHFQKQGQRS